MGLNFSVPFIIYLCNSYIMSSILSDIETVIYKGDSINNAYNLKQRIKDQMVRFLFAKRENDYRFDMDLRRRCGSTLWIANTLKMVFIREYVLHFYDKKSNKDRIKALFTLDNEDWLILKENNLIQQESSFKHTEKTDLSISTNFINIFYFSTEFENEIIKYLMYRK